MLFSRKLSKKIKNSQVGESLEKKSKSIIKKLPSLCKLSNLNKNEIKLITQLNKKMKSGISPSPDFNKLRKFRVSSHKW